MCYECIVECVEICIGVGFFGECEDGLLCFLFVVLGVVCCWGFVGEFEFMQDMLNVGEEFVFGGCYGCSVQCEDCLMYFGYCEELGVVEY